MVICLWAFSGAFGRVFEAVLWWREWGPIGRCKGGPVSLVDFLHDFEGGWIFCDVTCFTFVERCLYVVCINLGSR